MKSWWGYYSCLLDFDYFSPTKQNVRCTKSYFGWGEEKREGCLGSNQIKVIQYSYLLIYIFVWLSWLN